MQSDEAPRSTPSPGEAILGKDSAQSLPPPAEVAAVGTAETEQLKTQDEAPGSQHEDERSNKEIGNAASKEDRDKQTVPDLEALSVKRSELLRVIRRRTGLEWDRTAAEGFLDHLQAIDMLIKAATYQEPVEKELAPGERQVAKPEIKRMGWDEWTKTMRPSGGGTRANHSAIDVLYDEPQPVWTPSMRRPLYRSAAADGPSLSDRQQDGHCDDEAVAAAPKTLPSRIRINSVPAKRILDALCNDELAFVSETDPLVLVRPYKVLTLMDSDIRARLKEIEAMHTLRVEKAEISKGDSAQSSEKLDGTLDRGESTKKGANETDTGQIETGRPDSDLDKRAFPRNMIFFGDTDWSILTDSEVKEAVDDFRCLVRFMDETLMPARSYLQAKPTVISYHNIWHLFKTGELVYVKDRLIPQKVWRVVQATGGRRYLLPPSDEIPGWESKHSPFVLDCYYLDFDGNKYVRVYARFKIEVFEDSMPILSLPIVPLHLAETAFDAPRDSIRARGEQFLTYTKRLAPQYRYYQGTTVTQTPCGNHLFRRNSDDISSQRLFTERVESQVVVDFERGLQANPEWGPVISEIALWKIENAELEDHTEYVEKDGAWDIRASDDFLKVEQEKWQRWDKGEELPGGDDLLLFPNRVIGYVLRTRNWACLRLRDGYTSNEYLGLVDRREDAWQDLEIPQGHKSVVQALINTHFSKDKAKDAHFDLVREKGKGVIILLHGVPGVGKTATAECVAASHGKPLLPITCGDLGLKPKEVESTLQTAFQLAQAWDCVMLLDEADIFLAQRTNQDIERNALVSVFLRILEYYEGILFLTTNRVGSFDEAFKSRIHMALYYPPLNWPTTDKIWRNLIRRAQESPMKVEFNIDALTTFAWQLFENQRNNVNSIGPVWNGRQIRNAFQSALALARNESDASHADNVVLEDRHFNTVAEVSNEFNHYIWRVKSGRTDADIAQEVGARADGFSQARYAQNAAAQAQVAQFPPPAHTQMPMRQATPSANPLGFATPQSAQFQQSPYPAATGSPYNPNQQAFYPGTQAPPPQFGLAQGYAQQQPQPAMYGQHLQATPGQSFQTPQGQQYQGAPQPAPSFPPQQHQQQPQSTGQPEYATAGASAPGMPPQGPQTVNQRA